MNSSHVYMHGYCLYVNDFFILFFSLFCQTTSLLNIYNNSARQNKKEGRRK